MQIILTEEEYAALKVKKGVCPEAVASAKQELVRKLSQHLSNSSDRFQCNDFRHALARFDDEISAAIKAAAQSQ